MFRDRTDAGKRLADALINYKGLPIVVYALPRGGGVLGVEVARALEAPLDLIVVRKIGHPLSSEYAIGAVAENGYVVTNPVETATIDGRWIDRAAGVRCFFGAEVPWRSWTRSRLSSTMDWRRG